MITKEIRAELYICEKCQKEYKLKSSCKTHENSCTFKGNTQEVFFHDGKYTYPTSSSNTVRFYRMCKVSYTAADHHVWVDYNKQFTIGESEQAYFVNNNYAKGTEPHSIIKRISSIEYFDFCHELGTSWGNKIPIHENIIHVDDRSLDKHDIYVTYERGKKVKVDYNDPVREYGNGKIIIKKNNRIKKIEIFDKEILKKELVKSTHTLDIDMKDNLLYMKKYECLYEFKACHYGVKEEIAREFLKKTKMDLSDINGVLTLDGRRVSSNTDDWLDIHTKEVLHFQGSRSHRHIYGLYPYKGSTVEEAILNRAFSLASQRVLDSPKLRFNVGNLKVMIKTNRAFTFINETTGEEISHKKMLKTLKDNDGIVSVEYH